MKKATLLAVFLLFAMLPKAHAGDVYPLESFETGSAGWTATGLWHRADSSDPCAVAHTHSGTADWYYGTSLCTYDTGSRNAGLLTSPEIILPAGANAAMLSFFSYYETETSGPWYDVRYVLVSVDGGGWTPIQQLAGDQMDTWVPVVIDLSAYTGHTVRIGFSFDTIDEILNAFRGWYIDDVLVVASGFYSSFDPVSYSWIDIADPANVTAIAGDDAGGTVPLGFTFNYWGNPYTTVNISTNGYLTFGPDVSVWGNQNIPNTAVPNNVIAPFWDDLYIYSSANAKIYATTVGTAPDRKFVVTWSDADFCCAMNNGRLTFQAILSESDLSITYQYRDMVSVDAGRSGGNSATIGLENSGGTDAKVFSYNTLNVTDGLAIRSVPLDSDGNGTPDMVELLTGANPVDSDHDGVPDILELLFGTDPATNNGPTTITSAGPGSAYGTAYFAFSAGSFDSSTEGFRVYYGPQPGVTIDDYPAFFDIPNTAANQTTYIDQSWGMQGSSMVYVRIAAYKTISGGTRKYIGAPSNELATYFAGAKNDPANQNAGAIANDNAKTQNDLRCFIATAAYGSPFEKQVVWLRLVRDRYLLTNAAGAWLVKAYYRLSPPLARFISRHAWARGATRIGLLPLIGLSWVLVQAPMALRIALIAAFLALPVLCILLFRRRTIKT